MQIRIPQTVTITEASNLDSQGEVRVALGGQATQFTQSNAPNQVGYRAYLNGLGSRSLLVDDELNVPNPSPITFLGNPVTTATAAQIGDSFSSLIGNLSYSSNRYRLQASNSPTIIGNQPRLAVPWRADREVKIVGTSLMNCVTTLDTGPGATTGPGGADTFIGGDGNDQFVVFDSAAVIIESVSGGFDIAYFVGADTFNIGANVEQGRLSASGTGLIGNASDNLLVGNNAGLASFIDGGSGQDTIFGTAAADTLIGGVGNDTIYTQSGNDVLRYNATVWGVDLVGGFAPGAHLHFTAARGVTAFGQLTLTLATGNTQVDAAGGSILVFGASLTSSDFISG